MVRVQKGERVLGKYMDHPVQGVVLETRVKYGGKIQLTVLLDKPIQLRWRTDSTTHVLMDADKVVTVG